MKTSLFLLGSILLGSVLMFGFGHSAMAMTSGITLTPPALVDVSGQPLTSFQIGQEIGVSSTLTNHGTSDEKLTYLVQVMDSNGGTDFLQGSSLLGNGLPSNQTITESQVWIPKSSGQYTVEVFVWSSLTSAVPLTDVLHTTITVE
ncbi:MAG TPA: hypothetical protein VJ571_08040 [Candidatus Nitrosotalea sp.]|nr:hypothetical protein [Candidatus Nitrosotalea sp.]